MIRVGEGELSVFFVCGACGVMGPRVERGVVAASTAHIISHARHGGPLTVLFQNSRLN